MRKSLLITSALGLISALPTFAMANAAAGSSAAACGSGFFAQIDAKIMNAKLEIKNEKGSKSTVEASLPDTDKGVADQIKDDYINAGKTADTVVLLDIDMVNKANVVTAIGAYQIGDIDTDAKLDAKLAADGDVDVQAALRNADQKAAIREYLQTTRNVGLEAGLDKTLPANRVFARRATKTGDVEFIFRIGGEVLANVVAKLTATEVTGAGADFRNIRTVYIVNNDIIGAGALDKSALKKAVQDNFGSAPFKAQLDTVTDASVSFANLVATKKADNVKFNTQLEERKKLEVIDRRVHHHALAGGVGATAGWWQNMGGFAVSISGTGDYLWGTFRTMDDASGSSMKAEDKKKLGFGFQGDVGVHYVVSPSTTLGVLVGFRGQQLQFGRTDKTKSVTNSKDSKGDYASKWMWNPVVSAQARTFFTDTVYGALTLGYVIPMSERDYKLENTNITNKDAKVRFQGLTGAFSVGMMF